MSNLFRVGLENAAAASLMALVAFAASRFLKRSPALVHAFLLLVLLKLVTPPLWSFPVVLGLASPEPEVTAIVEARPEGVMVDKAGLNSAESAAIDPEKAELASPDFADTIVMEPEPEPEVALALNEDSEPSEAVEPPSATMSGGGMLAVIWVGGSVVTLLLSILATRRFARVLALAKPASPSLEIHVEEAAARIGLSQIPETFLIDWDRPPMVWALGRRPSLMIPSALWWRLDPGQRETLLIHELAHLKRGDHLVRWLELAVSVLFWWLPVVWWTRRALRETEEDCCDAWVIWALPKSARCYADTLVETVDFLSESRTQAPLLASGFGHVRHLKRRLTMIMQGNATRRLGLREGLAILALGAAFLPLNPSMAEPPAPSEDVKAETLVTTDVSEEKDAKTGQTITITKTVTSASAAEGSGGVTITAEAIAPPAPPAPPEAPIPSVPATAAVPSLPPLPPVPAVAPTFIIKRFAGGPAGTLSFSSTAVGSPSGDEDTIASTITRLQISLKRLIDNPDENKERNNRRIKAIKLAIEALQGAQEEPKVGRNRGQQARIVVQREQARKASSNRAAHESAVAHDLVVKEGDLEDVTEDIRGPEESVIAQGTLNQEIRTLRDKLQSARRTARSETDPAIRNLEQRLNQLTARLGEKVVHDYMIKLPDLDKLKQQEDRLSAMEKTLEKVLEELKSLKKEGSN